VKNWLLGIAALAVVVYAFCPLASRESSLSPDVTVLQFWHPWSAEYADALAEVVAEFNRTHPKIHVNALFMPTGAGENMKFFASVAGGVPPDVIVVDGTQVATWADLGVLRPLDSWVRDCGITADDFWGPCWEQCQYHGKTWALSAAADPNFSLVWNKHLFREAGLDPEKPPRTLTELESYCRRLTKYEVDGKIVTLGSGPAPAGRIEQLGFMPTYGASLENAIMTWGWAFGGQFYDPKTEQFTCDDPKIVKAVEWLLHMRDIYGGQMRLTAFQSGFGEQAQHPFYMGKLAMHSSYIAETQNINKFAPNLEYGIAPLPGPKDGEIGVGWIGGWALAIPYGFRGHDQEAFELIKWMTADPQGTTFISRKMKLLPAYRKSPFFETDVPGDPILRAYYQILQNAKHARPVTPANSYYLNELRRAVGWAMQDLLPPLEALQRARERTTEYLRKIEAQTKAKHVQR
jgi:multiple sugar transport system substrate-binding protein